MPATVAHIRADMCARVGCAHEPDFFRDPCASCKVSGWGKYSRDCEKMGLGDAIEILAKPLAKLLHLPCLDKTGTLIAGSDCANRRDALNRLTR